MLKLLEIIESLILIVLGGASGIVSLVLGAVLLAIMCLPLLIVLMLLGG